MAGLLRRIAASKFCALILSCLLAAAAAPVTAQDELILNVALMEDPTASLEVEDVVLGDFEPVRHTTTLWYTSSAQWLRLLILPAPDGDDVVLIVRPPMLDDVTLYSPVFTELEGASGQATAERYQLQGVDWPSPLRGYHITPPEGGAYYYVRITSTGPLAMSVTAQTRTATMRMSLRIDLLQIGYLAFMLGLLVWALQMLATTREGLFGWFAAMQLAWIFHNTLLLGYVTTLVPRLNNELTIVLFRISLIVASLLSLTFHRAMLRRFRPAALALWSMNGLIGFMCIVTVIFWVIDNSLGRRLHAFGIAATPVILLANALTSRDAASPGLRIMQFNYVILSVVLTCFILSISALGDDWIISLYGYMLHGVTVGVLMFTVLHLHGRNLAKFARIASARFNEMEYRNEIEQDRNRTLAQFIDMLSHEAKNALAAISMSVTVRTVTDRQRARVATAIVGLTAVIDRCNQVIRLDSKDQAILREECSLAEILYELCADSIEAERITLKALDPAVMQGDTVLLRVVFGNLLENAIKYSPPGSEISVVLAVETDRHSVLFQNAQGAAGMPDPAQVFKKYYRSHRAKEETGSGLGLYIVRELVHLMGGSIDYLPTGQNVMFKVMIPC